MKKLIRIFTLLILSILCFTGCTTVPQNPTEKPNTTETKPVFYGVVKEFTYYVGDQFDPLYGVTAFDKDKNDVTEYIEVFGNLPIENGILTTEGTYYYELLVIVNSKQILSEDVKLTVPLSVAFAGTKPKVALPLSPTCNAVSVTFKSIPVR